MVPWSQPDAAGQPPRAGSLNESVRAKKLPCGHILHLKCLKAWLERQQACPTCRRPVIPTGTSATDRAGADNQNAGPGANGGAQGGGNAQPGAPGAGNGNARPQNRLRMINLGPIRIGVYNGPANQVQDALNQRRAQQNGNATAAATPAVTPGLGGLAAGRSGDTQFQLLQIEERLMHEAARLQIEQAQLATLQAMEAEMARLRARYSQIGQGVPGSTGTARANLFPPPMMGPGAAFAPPQTFQPATGQAPMMEGHQGLPPGLVLPEGWTLAPLNRVGGTAGAPPGTMLHASPVPTPITSVAQEQTEQSTSAAPEARVAASPTEQNTPTISPQVDPLENNNSISSMSPQAGSTYEQAEGSSSMSYLMGTPLSTQVEQPATATAEDQVDAPHNIGTSGSTQSGPGPETVTRQEEGPTWSFDNVEAQASNGQTATEAEATPQDKGKGRAVTVEDVEDAED